MGETLRCLTPAPRWRHSHGELDLLESLVVGRLGQGFSSGQREGEHGSCDDGLAAGQPSGGLGGL